MRKSGSSLVDDLYILCLKIGVYRWAMSTNTENYSPRGGHNASPSTPPAEPEDMRRLAPLMGPPPEHSRPRSHRSSESVSPRTTVRPASPEPSSSHPSKRIRIGFEHYVPAGGPPRSPIASIPPPDTSRSWQQRELPRIHEDVLCRFWQTDPYVSGSRP